MKANIKLYKNDGSKNGRFPVKLILSHNRKVRRKTLGHSKESQWNEDSWLPLKGHPNRDYLFDLVKDIQFKMEEQEFIEMEDFEKAFSYLLSAPQKKEVDFLAYGETRAQFMDDTNHIGNAKAYRTALNELRKYQHQVNFSDITPEFLHGFKEWKQRDVQASNSTLRAYLYAYKAIYTAAVDNGLIQDMEPFKKTFKSIPKIRRYEDVS